MSNFSDSENIDTIIEEVLEDLITAVMSDSSVRQIETTVQSVYQYIEVMEFGYGDHLQLDTGTDYMDKIRRKVNSGSFGVGKLILRAARTAWRRIRKRKGCTAVRGGGGGGGHSEQR